MKQVAENAVVTAEQFNASLFSQLFLVRIGVAEDDSFVGPVIQTPGISQLATSQYELLVTPDRLQFSPKGETDADRSRAVREVLAQIVESLPHTPYAAMGLNFGWLLEIEDAPVLTRNLFFKADSVLGKEFSEPDARFGGYFSKDMLGGRLRLNAKPVVKYPGETQHLQLDFNFDKKLPEDRPLESLKAMLGNWDEARDYARNLAHLFETAR